MVQQNTEVKIDEKGNKAVVFVTDPNQVAATCFVDWKADGVYIRRRVFKTRSGAERFAARFFAGLR